MINKTTAPRQTKYCQAIEAQLGLFGHATNAQLLRALRREFSGLSATTVHRATARMAARGSIAIAPASPDGATRYDSNIEPHDHFMCTVCGTAKDADIKSRVAPILESAIGDCTISGRLTVMGVCKACKEKYDE